MTYGYDKMTVR